MLVCLCNGYQGVDMLDAMSWPRARLLLSVGYACA